MRPLPCDGMRQVRAGIENLPKPSVPGTGSVWPVCPSTQTLCWRRQWSAKRHDPTSRFPALCAPTRISPSLAFFAVSDRVSASAWTWFVRRVAAIFIHELAPSSQSLTFQCSVDNGGLNSAAGFMGVSAVAEPATRRQLRNFREQGADAMGRIADMKRAHSRRIDYPATARDGVNRARGRGMASFRVVFTNSPVC